MNDEGIVLITKENNRYRLTSISTADFEDSAGDTYTVQAIDKSIERAKVEGMPEYRLFHRSNLGIGRVTKMRRVGIFAIEEGYSYEDEFSLAVCKAISEDKSGKWRVSRGFIALKLEGECSKCKYIIEMEANPDRTYNVVTCPGCGCEISSLKQLNRMKFHDTIVKEISATERPCLQITGFSADLEILGNIINKGEAMNAQESEVLKRIQESGLDIPQELVAEKLRSATTSTEDIEKENVMLIEKSTGESNEPKEETTQEDVEESADEESAETEEKSDENASENEVENTEEYEEETEEKETEDLMAGITLGQQIEAIRQEQMRFYDRFWQLEAKIDRLVNIEVLLGSFIKEQKELLAGIQKELTIKPSKSNIIRAGVTGDVVNPVKVVQKEEKGGENAQEGVYIETSNGKFTSLSDALRNNNSK